MKKAKIGLIIFGAVVLIGSFSLTSASAQEGSYPDLSIWLNQWFKISSIFQELHFSDIGVPPDPGQEVEHETSYLVLKSLTPFPFDPNISPVLRYNIYVQSDDDGSWQPFAFDFNSVGGNVSNFAGWSDFSSPSLHMGFTIQIKGTQKKDGTFTGATIKTLGGYTLEMDVDPGDTERWVGSMKFSGTWVNRATLCKSAKNSTLPPCIPQP